MIDYEAKLSAMVLDVEDAEGAVPVEVANLRDTYDEYSDIDGNDALAACWHYMADGFIAVDEAIDFTMKRFKGFFSTLGEFAKDFYTGGDAFNGALGDATANLPYTDVIDFADYIDWDALGDDLETNRKIEVVTVNEGVYVFDVEDL